MDIRSFSKMIIELLVKDDLEQAFQIFFIFLQNNEETKNDFLLQSTSLKILTDKYIKGIISSEDFNDSRKQIRNALLDEIQRLEDFILENPEFEPDFSLLKGSKNTKNITQTHYGKGDNIGGDKIINF